MKKLVSAALAASVFAGPVALARTTANEADVRQSQNEGQRLTTIQAGVLRARVALAQIALIELRKNQALMDKVGVEHNGNWKTISLGVGTAAAEIAGGLATAYYLPKEEYMAWDKEVRVQYSKLNEVEDQIKELRAKRDPKIAVPAETEVAAALDAQIAEKVTQSESYARAARQIEGTAPLWKKVQRPIRLGLAYGIAPLLVLDGASTLLQLSFDPEKGDELVSRLSKFVDDARATLRDRR